jgi:enterochelin esterase family protein
MDNLVAEKKAKPMLIVMDNLNAVKPGESAALYFARGSITQAVPEPPRRLARRREGAQPVPAGAGEDR